MGFKQANFGYRHLVALLGFLSCVLINLQRLSLSVAIVDMLNHTALDRAEEGNSTPKVCPIIIGNSSIAPSRLKKQGEFNWSSEERSYVFSALYFGFFVAMLPGAKVAERIQARRMVLYGTLLSSFSTLLSPTACRWHVYAMVALQFIRGIGQGSVFTANFMLMANWFPRTERAFLASFVMSGHSVGGVIAGPLAGWICDQLQWPTVFYVIFGLGMSLVVLILMTLHETPKLHPLISASELKLITGDKIESFSFKGVRTPWRKIFSSVPTYALICALFGQYWTFAYFQTVHSTFLGTIQHFRITQNGFLTSLPFLLKAIAEYLSSSVADWLLRRKYVGVNMLRKGCNSLGCIGFSAAVLGTYFADCNGTISAVSAAVAMFFVGVATPGAVITCIDMSPRFAGSLSGIMNTVGSSAKFILPIVVGRLTVNETLEEWRVVFLISIAIVIIAGSIFVIFGSAEVQPWNDVEATDNGNAKNTECLVLEQTGR